MPTLLDCFHPVLDAGLLRPGAVRGVEVDGARYALFRDHQGRPGALRDACPHRFAPLSLGKVRPDGTLSCPYHGWYFDRDGRGANPSQPGLSGCDADALQVVERHGHLWIAARDALVREPPALHEPGDHPIGSYSRAFSVPLHVLFSNFLDVEHVPFIHSPGIGLLDGHFGPPTDFTTHVGDDQVTTTYHYRAAAAPGGRWAPLRSTRLVVERVSRFDPLRLTDTVSWVDDATGVPSSMVTRIVSVFVPETLERTRVTWFAAMRSRGLGAALVAPLLRRAYAPLLRLTTRQDEAFLSACAHIPYETAGMRLDRFDGPITANLKVLRRSVYRPSLKLAPAPAAPAVAAEVAPCAR